MYKKFLAMTVFASVAAATFKMADDAGASTTETAAPTKESLIERVEALFARGVEGVETMLHDAIAVVEGMFAGDDEVTLGNDAPATQTEQAAPATNETPAQ
jgi:hypothetical protein